MEPVAFAAVVVALIVCGWLLDRRDRRHQEDRNRLLTLIHDERDAMAQRVHDERIALETARAETTPDLAAMIALVEKLCQRLQAPKEAIVQHQMDTGPQYAPPAILPDDDAGWYAAQQVTKEELADLMTAEELEARGAH